MKRRYDLSQRKRLLGREKTRKALQTDNEGSGQQIHVRARACVNLHDSAESDGKAGCQGSVNALVGLTYLVSRMFQPCEDIVQQ